MSSNVGLTTPRGSGTSGYVQRNLSLLKPRDNNNYSPYPGRVGTSSSSSSDTIGHRPRKPDQQILNHDRLREIEVKVFDLRDKLEDEEVEEEEIERRCGELREGLLAKGGKGGKGPEGGESSPTNPPPHGHPPARRQFKTHQVHEQAEAKILESEKLRRALGISKDYEEGGHWRKKEERMRESLGGGEER